MTCRPGSGLGTGGQPRTGSVLTRHVRNQQQSAMTSATATPGLSRGLGGNKLLPLALWLSVVSCGPTLSPQTIGPGQVLIQGQPVPGLAEDLCHVAWFRERAWANLSPLSGKCVT